MSDLIVQTQNLNYSFKKGEKVLHELSLNVPNGSIYGFLGPNGAGKTTTLRLLLGLLKQQEGKIEIFGKHLAENRSEILSNIGSLIEQPSLYLHLSGEENLNVYRHIFGLSKERVNEILEIVDLTKARKKKARGYSLGMKQRLSIGIALLHNPKLLILDEPTNGLDPNGIIDMRNLLGKLNKELGTTIIISSHLLAEIEKIATHVGIISYGKMMFEGSLKDLQLLKAKQAVVKLETNNIEKTKLLLEEMHVVASVSGETLQFEFKDKEQNAALLKHLIAKGIEVYTCSIETTDLENIFLQITNN